MPNLSAKQIAINVAKQAARESNEFLKTAGQQVLATPESSREQESNPTRIPQEREAVVDRQQQAPKKDLSFMNIYKNELEQIRQENLFKELQKRIAEGEEIPLEDFATQLTSEQREVLKAQMEAVRVRKEAMKKEKSDTIPQIVSKRARGMIGGMVKKRNEQHIETRQAPSG